MKRLIREPGSRRSQAKIERWAIDLAGKCMLVRRNAMAWSGSTYLLQAARELLVKHGVFGLRGFFKALLLSTLLSKIRRAIH